MTTIHMVNSTSYYFINHEAAVSPTTHTQTSPPSMHNSSLNRRPMKSYTFFWKNGNREILKGNDVADALIKAGHSASHLYRLAFYLPGENKDFEFDPQTRKWKYSPSMVNNSVRSN